MKSAGDYQTLLAERVVQHRRRRARAARGRRRPQVTLRCAPATTVTVTTTHTFGRTGPRARTPTRTTRTAGGSSRRPAANSYVNIDITKLMSEQPDDGLEVYDTQSGDLMAAFTGRWDPADLPEIRAQGAREGHGPVGHE